MHKHCIYVSVYLPRRLFSTSYTYKSSKKLKWNELKHKKFGSDYALENFDEFYKPVFGKRWPGIRLGLLTVHKYCAFANNFEDTDRTRAALEARGARDVRLAYDGKLRQLFNAKPELRLSAGSAVVAGSLSPGDDIKSSAMLESGPTDDNITESASDGGNIDGTNEIGAIVEESDIYSEQEEEEDKEEVDEFSNRFASRDLSTGAGSFQEFVPATQLQGLEDWLDESNFASTVNTRPPVNFTRVVDSPIFLPTAWNVFAYRVGDISTFPTPKTGDLGMMDYYLMDASSILPAFALNPKNGDHILDMCAAPGGKCLSILQTLQDVRITCNDVSMTRANRLRNVLNSYIPPWGLQDNRIEIKVGDGRDFKDSPEMYDKVLLDSPCTNDRLSVNDNENNIFSLNRIKERVTLPQLQTELLVAALTTVKRGGYVVYSTCSLSPVQNDGVINVALQQMWETSSDNFVIHDLTERFFPFSHLFEFHASPRYGQLVVPSTTRNFGPMYVAKISKV